MESYVMNRKTQINESLQIRAPRLAGTGGKASRNVPQEKKKYVEPQDTQLPFHDLFRKSGLRSPQKSRKRGKTLIQKGPLCPDGI